MSFNSADFNPLPPSQTIQFEVPTDKVETIMLSEFRNSPNLISYIKQFTTEIDEVSKAIQDTINYRHLADATGKQLDVIGEIVGVGRIFYGAAALGYFGFYDDPQAAFPSIGSTTDTTKGGIYKSITDPDAADYVMDDVTYKKAIYAKILKNMTNCCIEDVLLYIDLMVGYSCNTQITETSCAVAIYVHENLTQVQRIALSVTIDGVRPAGVAMTLRDNRGFIDIKKGNKYG